MNERIIESFQRRLDRIDQELTRRPIKQGHTVGPVWTLEIIGGNLLSDGVTQGVVYVSGGVASIPAAYNPDVDTTFINGIGRAYLRINGTLQTNKVLVVNDPRTGSVDTAYWVGRLAYASSATVAMPVDTGGYKLCYIMVSP